MIDEDLNWLKANTFIEAFAICGNMIAMRYSHTIFVYRNPENAVSLKRRESLRTEVSHALDETDTSRPVCLFQPNELGWIYAVTFIRRFGGKGKKVIFKRQ